MSTSGSTSVRVDGEMRYGSVSQTSVSTTALAYRLAPPTEPSRGFTCNGVSIEGLKNRLAEQESDAVSTDGAASYRDTGYFSRLTQYQLTEQHPTGIRAISQD